MIKLIASDLDGTLLQNGAQELTPRAIKLIREITQKGIHFVAASGRQYDNERRIFEEIKDEISYIAENGSLCIHQGKVISRGIIPDDLVRRILDEIKKRPGFEIVVSREDFIVPDCNKGTALRQLMDLVTPEECIAFGDQYNDVEMLELAGKSYAMGNSAPGIAEHADCVTDSVEDVLEKLLASL